ncbi:kielin/chordin-like protein [Haliotis cracherodii]|uniref:kielin/chordin-like protein n=1 Tax=Haliotis cracherodii TaxID=6455 RepID=UPI0039EA526F
MNRECLCAVVVVLFVQISLACTCSTNKDCADNAHCDDDHCVCDDEHVGHGKYLCQPDATSCACASYGDPHIRTFQGDQLNAVFPCTHVLAQYGTDTCGPVVVYGTSVRRGTGVSAVYESEVFWFIQRGTTSFSGRISGDGIFVDSDSPIALPATLGDSNLSVHLSQDRRWYYTVSSPQCHTQVAFHWQGVITLAAPRSQTSYGHSTCGTCGGSGSALVELGKKVFGTSNFSVRQKRALDLTNELVTTVDSDNSLCSNISRSTLRCKTERAIVLAAEACVDFTDRTGVFRHCLGAKETPEVTLGALARCVSAHCAGDFSSACSIKVEYGRQCVPVVDVKC